MDPSTGSSKRKEPPASGDEGGAKRKKYFYQCKFPGCTNRRLKGGVCTRHGAKQKKCSVRGCENNALKGGVCKRHGAKVQKTTCKVGGCSNKAVQGGVCQRHGAEIRKCSVEGCHSQARGGYDVCIKHGAEVKKCKEEGCNKNAKQGGVCQRHGAERKKCSVEGCDNRAVKGGVCQRHGAEVKKCSADGCNNRAVQGGVCRRHGAEVKKCKEEGCQKWAQGGLNGHCFRHSTVRCSRGGCESKARVGGLCMWHYVRRPQNQTSVEANVEAAEAKRGAAVQMEATEARRASVAATRTRRTRMRGQRQVSCLHNLPGGEIVDNLLRSDANDSDETSEEVDGECMLCCEPYQVDAHRSRLVCRADDGCGTFAMCRLCLFRSSIMLKEPVEIDNEAGYSFVDYDSTMCPQCRKGGAFQESELPALPDDVKRAVEAEISEGRDREQVAAHAFEDGNDEDDGDYEPQD